MRLDAIIYLGLSSGLIGLLSAWLFALLTYPVIRRAAASRRNLSSGCWFGVGVAPFVVGISFFGFSVAFGWLSFAGWLPDHCPLHPGHPHLCLTHIALAPPGGIVFWLALGLGGCWMTLQTVRIYLPGRALSAKLAATCRPDGGHHLLSSRIAAAFTAGLFFPRVYLTTRAAQLLRPQEREIVLIHEQTHVRRRDPLRSMILALSERCFPGMKAVRQLWLLAAETECDRAAVRAGFSETLVAKTILKLKRANQHPLAHAALLHYASWDGDVLRTRLHRLLSGSPHDDRLQNLWILLPVFWLLAFLCLPEIHHAMETLLGWLS